MRAAAANATTAYAARFALATLVMVAGIGSAAAGEAFLDDAEVVETLVDHTLRGKDWIEYYTGSGEIQGKVRYFGMREYTGRWSVKEGRVCYVYERAEANTCSFLRKAGETISHHLRDGTLKKDGVASRMPGRRLDAF